MTAAFRRSFLPLVETLEDRWQPAAILIDGTLLIVGTSGNDVITVNNVGGNFVVSGESGTFAVADVNEIRILAGDGNDQVFINASVTTSAVILGGPGDDLLRGGGGADTILGGDGDDTIMGGGGEDKAFGGNDNDFVGGDEADDTVMGGGGDDTIMGGVGNDSVHGGTGADRLLGEEGNDTCIAGDGNDTVLGGGGDDRLVGGGGDDSMLGGDGDDTMLGTSGNDSLHGNAGSDYMVSGDGTDLVDGGDGNDRGLGGEGIDTVLGGTGDDTALGGAGDDSVVGGPGEDITDEGPEFLARDDTTTTPVNTAKNISVGTLLANDEGQNLVVTSVTAGTNGTAVLNNNSTPTNPDDDFVVFTPTAGFTGTATFTYTMTDGTNTDTATVRVTVGSAADTPSVTNATTNEDTQTTSGLVISRNAGDGAEVTHFKITNITNGTLFQNDGTTPITNGSFITFAQANAGLKFTPSANFSGTASFQVQASTSNTDAGLGGSVVTATITVNPVADTPSVTDATTEEDTQTTSGLVVSRNAADGSEVTHFKITGITNGTLFQNDGTTAINNGSFITFAQANAGLKFTPAAGFTGTASFQVQASTSSADAGLGGSVVTANITVNADGADTPSVTNATTNEDTQTTSGLVISRNAGDGAEVTHFKITNITNGTLFQNDGTTPITNGSFITFAQANAGLKFTPDANEFGSSGFGFDVQASLSNADGGLGGSVVTATVTVNAVADTPSVTNATTTQNTQTTSGLVVSRNAADGAEVTHFKITNISDGSLFQNDGTTAINNGDFITFAQVNAGLKFTPATDFTGIANFDLQASTSNADAGLGGSVVTADITVNA